MKDAVITFAVTVISIFGLYVASLHADESMGDLLKDMPEHAESDHAPKEAATNSLNPASRSSAFKKKPLNSEEILDPFQPKLSDDPVTYQEIVTLAALEKEFRAAPEVLVAVAELEESLSILEQKRARSGLKVFGGAGVGAYREPVTDTLVRDFQRANVKIGLRYPLLGSLEQERFDIFNAESKTKAKEHEIELINRKSLVTLRMFYINFWGNQRKIEISRAFLDNEQEVEQILDHRTTAGYLLDADRQKFLSTFALVRRNLANMNASRNRALNAIRLMTKSDLNSFRSVTPKLPAPCQDLNELKTAVLADHPELRLLRQKVEDRQALHQANRLADIKADVSLAGTATSDLPDEQTGYGVALNLNIELPAKIGQAKTARREESQAGIKKVQRQLDLKRATLLQEAEEALDRYRATNENIEFATQRLKAGMEGLRENLLRSAYLEGDTIEQLQKSRYTYYQSAIDYIDAEINRMLAHVRLLQYASEGCPPKTAAIGIKKAHYRAVEHTPISLKRAQPAPSSFSRVIKASRFITELEKENEIPDKRLGGNRGDNQKLILNEIVIVSDEQPSTTPSLITPAQSETSASLKPCKNCYSVQVGAYRQLTGAQSKKRELAGRGDHPITIRTVDLPGKGRFYRVQMGQFKQKRLANRLVQHLVQTYDQSAIVVQVEN